jgi:hypothetical protein
MFFFITVTPHQDPVPCPVGGGHGIGGKYDCCGRWELFPSCSVAFRYHVNQRRLHLLPLEELMAPELLLLTAERAPPPSSSSGRIRVISSPGMVLTKSLP